MVEFEDEKNPRPSHGARLRKQLRDIHHMVAVTTRPGVNDMKPLFFVSDEEAN